MELYEKLDLVTCLYCNENKTKMLEREEGKNLACFELDHFYSKSQYPFLALSFFNLIPCCHICNSTLKGKKEFSLETHINPYDKSFDEFFEFKFEPYDTKLLIEQKETFPDNIVRNLELQSRYNSFHLEEAKNLRKRYMNNYHKLKTAEDIKENLEGIIWDTPLEAKKILRVERGKMKRDVLKSLGGESFLAN